MIALAGVAVLLLLPVITGYQANAIPFWLDQLSEAPSMSLVLFIPWIVWADTCRLGTFVVQAVDVLYECIEQWSDDSKVLLFAFLLSMTVVFVVIVVCPI